MPKETVESSGWPAVQLEARPWQRSGSEVASRRALLRAHGEYRAAVPPEIREASLSLSSETVALADDASAALARFDAEAGPIAAPFAAILLRTESASSSEIEQLTASAKQVALAELGASTSGNARLVVANVRAMRAALELASGISEAAIIAMQASLLGESRPELTGAFRDQQVWIGGGSLSPHGALFVPPHQDRVPALMADCVEFAERTDIPVLVHAALAHAQFETIHPFPDGNGRTGRALIHSMLRASGLTRNVTVPVSAGLLRNNEYYFAALTEYRAGNPAPIVAAVAEAAIWAVDNGSALVAELRELSESWATEIPSRRGSAAARLGELLLRQPAVTAQLVADELRVSIPAAQSAIDRFVAHGQLRQTNEWRRNRIWVAHGVLAALDGFAARARRHPPQ
ncbi:Fic family protein [Leucobacter albus]|uniref:Fic family protein n=1 Tax=Leucobacter albus TaxID=272210 RepID=A0ABW3TLK8_9MICO